MSASLVTMGRIQCDGDRWPCAASHQADGYHVYASETRQECETVGLEGRGKAGGQSSSSGFLP